MLRRLATAALMSHSRHIPPILHPRQPRTPTFHPLNNPNEFDEFSVDRPRAGSRRGGADGVPAVHRRQGRDSGERWSERGGVTEGCDRHHPQVRAESSGDLPARKLRGVGQVEVVWTKALKSAPSGANGQVTEVTVQARFDSKRLPSMQQARASRSRTATRRLSTRCRSLRRRCVEGVLRNERGGQVLIKLACVALALMPSALVVPAAADPIATPSPAPPSCRRNIFTGERQLNLESSKPVPGTKTPGAKQVGDRAVSSRARQFLVGDERGVLRCGVGTPFDAAGAAVVAGQFG